MHSHQPLLVVQDSNSEGFQLHGGPVVNNGTPNGAFSPELQYRCVNGQFWTSLLAISVQVRDPPSHAAPRRRRAALHVR